MTNTRCSMLAAVLCAVVAAGCSEGMTRQTLTTPSPVGEAGPALNDDRSSSTRRANTGETAMWADRHGWSAVADGLVVEGTDSITDVTGTCPAKTITVRGVPVAITSTTTFTAPMTCEGLTTGTTVKVTALLTFTSTGFTVSATNIASASTTGGGEEGGEDGETPGTGGPGSGKKARGEGVIGAITGSCPTLTLVITGTKVSTTSTTEYVGGSCETLRPGTKVTIDGELKPGGTATAEKIQIHSVPGGGKKVSGDGRVDTVTGDCPALTLNVRGVTVVTTSTTTYSGGTCGDIRRGSHIDVTGDYDGTQVEATAVAIKKP